MYIFSTILKLFHTYQFKHMLWVLKSNNLSRVFMQDRDISPEGVEF